MENKPASLLLCWEGTLFPHFVVVDRWPATPKQAWDSSDRWPATPKQAWDSSLIAF